MVHEQNKFQPNLLRDLGWGFWQADKGHNDIHIWNDSGLSLWVTAYISVMEITNKWHVQIRKGNFMKSMKECGTVSVLAIGQTGT